MKKASIYFICWMVTMSFLSRPNAVEAGSFDLTPYIDTSVTSNLLGLAVNPVNGNIFLTSLSYDGSDNLWEFTPDGTLVQSTRSAFDTGITGNLGSATIGNNGHLFIDASRGILSPDGLSYERYIIEMNQDGSTIFSSFFTDDYLGGVFGLTYDSYTDHLLIAIGRVGVEAIIRETTLDGILLNSFSLDAINWPGDIFFNPLTGNIFTLRHFDPVLDEYAQNALGVYDLVNSYDLTSVGISGRSMALDINRSNGLFYVQNGNEKVFEFNIDELDAYVPGQDPDPGPSPIPEPTTILLLGTGLIGLAGARRKMKS